MKSLGVFCRERANLADLLPLRLITFEEQAKKTCSIKNFQRELCCEKILIRQFFAFVPRMNRSRFSIRGTYAVQMDQCFGWSK